MATGRSSEQQPAVIPICDLPDEIFAEVAKRCIVRSRYSSDSDWIEGARPPPLLSVSRRCRDAVLQGLTGASLTHGTRHHPAADGNPSALARLLHRICTTAPTGLAIHLHVNQDLPVLLQPGISCGGWNKVHRLELFNLGQAIAAAEQQLCAAFPAVRDLRLKGMSLNSGSFFAAPIAWAHLSSLSLYDVSATTAARTPIAAALASLPKLRSLALYPSIQLEIAGQLTGLTNLEICIGDMFWYRLQQEEESEEEEGNINEGGSKFKHMVGSAIATAAHNAGLQHAKLEFCRGFVTLGPHNLRCLLEGCGQLTYLDLPDTIIDQTSLDLLLQHGPHITSLSVDSFQLSADRADRQCSWKTLHLELESQRIAPSLLQFAYLPIKQVETITTKVHPDDDDEFDDWDVDTAAEPLQLLYIPLPTCDKTATTGQLSALLSSAATCLAGSACWKRSPASSITIIGPGADQQQLLRVLAPLGGPHIRELFIYPRGADMQLGPSDVHALASSLGNTLTHVSLSNATDSSGSQPVKHKITLLPGFWQALASCFPAAKQLQIDENVVGVDKQQLLEWCQAMHRPVTVDFSRYNTSLCERQCDDECHCLDPLSAALEQRGCPGAVFRSEAWLGPSSLQPRGVTAGEDADTVSDSEHASTSDDSEREQDVSM